MSYKVEIVKKAEKELKSIDKNIALRIGDSLLKLGQKPHPRQSTKLKGTPFYRLRIGDYRVIYAVNNIDRKVTVLSIGHRREVYKGL